MTAILFIGHTFHEKSRSSAFFLDLLGARFGHVETAFLEPGTFDAAALPEGAYDLVVLWQLDFLAPHYIAAGYRTVVVPMYDASSSLPDLHFAMMREALFINFSASLHVRTVRLGCRSLHARYYPDPAAFAPVTDYSTPRGFFWRRRPDEIGLDTVDTMLGDSLASLHLHNAPDYGDPPPLEDGRIGLGRCEVTTSTWFQTPADYQAALAGANVYIAPRLCEGIGMGFLEAMARGMAVFANDLPTHNEYIANWYNGVLFNRAELGTVPLDHLAALGRNARHTVERGHRHWLLAARAAMDALAAHAAPRGERTEGLIDFAHAAIAAYRTSPARYADFLDGHKDSIAFYALGRLRDMRRLMAGPSAPAAEAADTPRVGGVITGAIHLTFGQGNANAYLETGWSTPEGVHTWIDGPRGVLRLPANPGLAGNLVMLTFDGFTVDSLAHEQTVDIVLDGETAATVPVCHTYQNGGLTTVHSAVRLPEKDQFHLEFRARHTWPESEAGRQLSLALRTLSIVRDWG